MPTANALLLPPPHPRGASEEHSQRSDDAPGSSRRLDEVGVEAVLEAMIEQKLRSSVPPAAAPAARHAGTDREGEGLLHGAPGRGRAVSDVFIKVR